MEMDASWVFVAKESTKSSVQITFVCFLLLFIVIISTKDKLSLDVLCNKFHDKRGFLLISLRRRHLCCNVCHNCLARQKGHITYDV